MKQSLTGWKRKRNGCSISPLYYQYKRLVLVVQSLCTDDKEDVYDNKMREYRVQRNQRITRKKYG